jgi:putative tryptophan/tyrosine transport system substrate-binding protein
MSLLSRRTFLAGSLTLLAAPFSAEAQQAKKVARIGYMEMDISPGDPGPRAFLQQLGELGYVEGQNLLIEYRDAKGKPERFRALAAELVALNVDVIVAGGGTLGALAAKEATGTIPIVFPLVGDPVADGLVSSLARPGGNLTGSSLVIQTVGKLLELLKQAAPGVSRIALLLKPDAAPARAVMENVNAAEQAAQALGLRLQVVEARNPQEFDRAFSDMSKAHTEALAVLATPVFATESRRLADLAIKNHLPTMFSLREFVVAGGLMSYGPNRAELFRGAATYVAKILKGAKPADLPVEQPTKFELVINLKTAKALGLTIPASLLARADQVIE